MYCFAFYLCFCLFNVYYFSFFTEFPDIKLGGVPEEVKEKMRDIQTKQHELQDVMGEVGQDKVSSHVKSYVVESTVCMNMAFNILTDMANLVKNKKIAYRKGY